MIFSARLNSPDYISEGYPSASSSVAATEIKVQSFIESLPNYGQNYSSLAGRFCGSSPVIVKPVTIKPNSPIPISTQ
jgi:hypothetical protein